MPHKILAALSIDDVGVGTMDYVCYVGRTKVDQLYEQVDPMRADESIKETVTREVSTNGKMGLSLPAFLGLGGDITYGRKNALQFERTLKQGYMAKLREVILAIYSDHGDVPILSQEISDGRIRGNYHYVEAEFSVDPDSFNAPPDPYAVARLFSPMPSGKKLNLDCTFRNFSESTDSHVIHSGNFAFFSGHLPLRLSGVIILLGERGDQIFGTPLYLKLTARDELVVSDAI